ncbi:type III secretion system effector F-box protein XopI [Xanthomonas graminis]|uniref:Type III secretion system effector protein n=1 Tax=Xanthomonas graminis pv. poae TaxID=227946 RepID=A0A199P7E1_9XANT|nr:type III secretion system effector F-box protein XopI [Xanthomonas translucens]OAX56808.1 type III secretion system effector protein [Xanthomonas translucens pv. poae]
MPINRTGLPPAAASSRQTEQASTSQAPASQPPPDPPAVQTGRAEIFDSLSQLPRDSRREIVRRLGPRSLARLGRVSRQMADDAREGMQAFLTARPRYDPSVEFGAVTSAERMGAALHAATHFPYPDDEDRSEQRLRAYAMLAARLPSLPEEQRFEAFTAVLDHATRFSGPLAFSVLARLTHELGSLPEQPGDLRALAFHAILPSLIATHRQAQAAEGVAAPGADVGAAPVADAGAAQVAAAWGAPAPAAVPAQEVAAAGGPQALPFGLLARAISQLPEAAMARAVTEAAALQTGSRLRAEVTLRFSLVRLEPIHLFQQAYAHVAGQLASSDNGAEALTHLAALSNGLPDPGMRQAAFRELTRAVSALASTEDSAAVLVRLAGTLHHQQAAARYLCSLDLLGAAQSLSPGEHIRVIVAVRAQAPAIQHHAAELIARCDQAIELASMMLATVSRRYMDT